MNFGEIFLIAVGLSMDAFAISITLGLSVKKPKIIEYLIPGIYFGFFQALMPLIGFFAGTLFAGKISDIEHWVAFALLGLVGGNMIRESFSKEEEKVKENPFNFIKNAVIGNSDKHRRSCGRRNIRVFPSEYFCYGNNNRSNNIYYINNRRKNRKHLWCKIQVKG